MSENLSSAAAEGRDTDRHATLSARIETGAVRVGIIGLGYVGLPLAQAFGARGIRVVGFDVDRGKVDKLQRGESYIGHIDAGAVGRMRAAGFEATAFSRMLIWPSMSDSDWAPNSETLTPRS